MSFPSTTSEVKRLKTWTVKPKLSVRLHKEQEIWMKCPFKSPNSDGLVSIFLNFPQVLKQKDFSPIVIVQHHVQQPK